MYEQMFIKNRHGFKGIFAGFVNILFVVRVAANEWAKPASKGWKDLLVGERHPAHDGGIILLGFAEKAGLLILRRNCCALARVLNHSSKFIVGKGKVESECE